MAGERRLTIVQYSGDFAEAAKRLAAGGPETYRAQRYTVDYVEGLAKRLDAVATIAGFTDIRYDEELPSGARAIGAGFKHKADYKDLIGLIESTKPDFLVLRGPLIPVLNWATRKRIRTLALLADSFGVSGMKNKLKNAVLRHYLNKRLISPISNHGINASRQLVQIGVPAEKIIPWDYPALNSPQENPVKVSAGPSPHLVYVGLVIADKGVFDLLDAVHLLVQRGLKVTAEIIGKGDTEAAMSRIAALGLQDQVKLAGLIPNDQIISTMRRADAVVVPSRHAYSEGMPLTIYEALCSRTPLITSDHPMFVQNVRHEESALVFPAGDVGALADNVMRLMSDAALYAQLSANSATAWGRLQLPVHWDKLIDAWIKDDAESNAWLLAHSLARYPYPGP